MKKLVALLSILSLAFLASCGNTESEVDMVNQNQVSNEVEIEYSEDEVEIEYSEDEVEIEYSEDEVESNEENVEIELDVELIM